MNKYAVVSEGLLNYINIFVNLNNIVVKQNKMNKTKNNNQFNLGKA
ncbi:MAG: hypothetical protein ACOCP8_00110 [archaeon]